MKYTIKYFINKFEAIPDEKWQSSGTIHKNGAKCALGHLGADEERWCKYWNEECQDFMDLFDNPRCYDRPNDSMGKYRSVYAVNDGLETYGVSSEGTPKQRILDVLYTKLREGAALK